MTWASVCCETDLEIRWEQICDFDAYPTSVDAVSDVGSTNFAQCRNDVGLRPGPHLLATCLPVAFNCYFLDKIMYHKAILPRPPIHRITLLSNILLQYDVEVSNSVGTGCIELWTKL
jgi:hypothetical protein